LLVRRECWDDLRGLDGDFFLYYEDVDLCRRAGERGWSVWYDPAVSIVHHRPLHLRRVPAHLRLFTRHALLTYARKHWPAWQTRLLGGIVKLESMVRRWWASWKGDVEAKGVFAALERIAEDVPAGRVKRAHRRLMQVVRRQEQSRTAGSGDRGQVDRCPGVDRPLQLQPCGSAVTQSRRRPAA
jgi:hypothetical protein